MSDPFLGEVKLFALPFAPKGWLECNGQLLPVSQNQALFALLGTTYGGDGRTTFALPDLRGRVPVHVGNGVALGERSGTEAVTLNVEQVPRHTHSAAASSDETASLGAPGGNVWGVTKPAPGYADEGGAALNPAALGNSGAGQAHPNWQPTSIGNYCIAVVGIFPSRN